MDFGTFALLAIGCLAAFFIIAVLFLTRHGARHVTITVLLFTRRGASRVLAQADLEQLRDETNSKIAKLENEINKLKAELAPPIPRLVDFSIVPPISLDNDPGIRNEMDSDTVQPANDDPQLEKAFSEIAKAFARPN